MRYKKGDRVRIVSDRTKDMNIAGRMDKYLGKVMTIKKIFFHEYRMAEDKGDWFWSDSMIAGLASEVPFDFGAWKDKNVCMHCRTREEAEDFCREMDVAGLRYSRGSSYLGNTNFNETEGVYYLFNSGLCAIDLYTAKTRSKGNILEWSNYRSTEPPKEEQEKIMETKIDDKPLSYQETMDIYKRLCEHHRKRNLCKECPVGSSKNYTKKLCRDFLIENTDKAEPILKQWAAEHPVKTNEQKCNEMFLEVFGMQYATALMHPDWWKREYIEPYKEKE